MVVLMCGISGSGKTTEAKRLENLGFERLSLDKIMWNRHGSRYMDLPFDQQIPLQTEAEKELLATLKKLLTEKRNVVVDSCLCKRAHRNSYRELVKRAGETCRIVYCSAPPAELRRRLNERTPGPDSAIVTEEMLNRFLQGFQPPQPDETDVYPPGIIGVETNE